MSAASATKGINWRTVPAGAAAIAVALLAALPAARRATTVEPMVAMRSE